VFRSSRVIIITKFGINPVLIVNVLVTFADTGDEKPAKIIFRGEKRALLR
jgi:hypothetical protein